MPQQPASSRPPRVVAEQACRHLACTARVGADVLALLPTPPALPLTPTHLGRTWQVPTHGVKNSLNVATCASVLIWEALRQWDVGEEGQGGGEKGAGAGSNGEKM